MLQAQPELRFSAEDVLDHPWLAVTVTRHRTFVITMYPEVRENPHLRAAAPAWLDTILCLPLTG